MKILITGGMGFIGSHLCDELLSQNHEVYVIDNLLKQVHGNDYEFIKGVDFTCGDVSDISTWKMFYGQSFDVLIHLAAETGTGQSEYEAARYCNTNIQSTAIINDLIVNKKIEFNKIILASSRAVYGDALLDNNGKPIASKEDDEKNPLSIYAITKLAQEQILLNGPYRDKVSVLRFQNVYGAGQSLNNPYTGIISIFSKLAKYNKDIQIFEDGLMSRDFVYVSDVIDSIVLCASNHSTDGEIYNVGTGNSISILEVANIIVKEFNSNSQINITGLKRKGDIRHNFANIDKIKSIGYSPKVPFNLGLEKFSKWISELNLIDNDQYEESLKALKGNNLLS